MSEMPSRHPEESVRLQTGILHLPDVEDLDAARDFYGSFYPFAVSNHAVLLVNFLVQMQDAGIRRLTPTLASFSTTRGSSNRLCFNAFMDDLSGGIVDVAQAAGVAVAFPERRMNAKWQQPEQFAIEFDSLTLPPALQKRIDPHRVRKELVDIIGRTPETPPPQRRVSRMERIFPVFRRKGRSLSVPEPDFRLQLVTQNVASEALPGQQPRLLHTISLAPPRLRTA